MMNKVKVVLCGKEYLLQTEEAPSYIYQLAKTLEKSISDITEANPRVSVHSAVMMVALSTMDELTKANTAVELIRSEVKAYVDEAGKARLERDAALREIEALKAKIEQLENLGKLHTLRADADSGKRRRDAESETAAEKPAEQSDAKAEADTAEA